MRKWRGTPMFDLHEVKLNDFLTVFNDLHPNYRLGDAKKFGTSHKIFPLRKGMQDLLRKAIARAKSTSFSGAVKTQYMAQGKKLWNTSQDDAVLAFEPHARTAIACAIVYTIGRDLLDNLRDKIRPDVVKKYTKKGILASDGAILKPAKLLDQESGLQSVVTEALTDTIVFAKIDVLFQSPETVDAYFNAIRGTSQKLGKAWDGLEGTGYFYPLLGDSLRHVSQERERKISTGVERLAKILKVSKEISLEELIEFSGLPGDFIKANIWDWCDKFGFQYANNKLTIKEAAVSDFVEQLNAQFQQWENREGTKEGKK